MLNSRFKTATKSETDRGAHHGDSSTQSVDVLGATAKPQHTNKINLRQTGTKNNRNLFLQLLGTTTSLLLYTITTTLCVTQVAAQTLPPQPVTLFSVATQLLGANSNLIDTKTDMQISLLREQGQDSAPWQLNQCYQVYFNSPYEDVTLYKTFYQEEIPECTALSGNFKIACSLPADRSDTLQFYISEMEDALREVDSIRFKFSNFHTPWSAHDLAENGIRVFATQDCSGSANQQRSIPGHTIVPRLVSENALELSSTSKVVGYSRADNKLIIKFSPETHFSKSGSGQIHLTLPSWYRIGTKQHIMFDSKAIDKCKAANNEMTIVSSTPETINRRININYKNMKPEFIQGAPVTLECRGFYNPIFQDQWMGFVLTTYDSEVTPAPIEVTQEAFFDATDYEATIIPDSFFRVQPMSFTIQSMTTYSMVLNMPIPMETECYIEMELPNDLNFDVNQIIATGIFARPGNDQISINEIEVVQDPVSGNMKAFFEGCYDSLSVGLNPSGTLMIDEISTPRAVKDSGLFKVKVYKDKAKENLIAEIESGTIVPSAKLSPGKVTDIIMQPYDTSVQAVTTYAFTMTTEHMIGSSGSLEIVFPQSIELPKQATELDVTSRDGSILARKAVVLVGNTIRIVQLFGGEDQKEGAEYLTFKFEVAGIKNQISSTAAGPIEITTMIQFADQFFTVDTGTEEDTFVATTGLIQSFRNTIVVENDFTHGTNSTYNLSFKCQSTIPINAFLTIQVPPELTMTNNLVTSSGSCKEDLFADCQIVGVDIVKVQVLQPIPAGQETQFTLGGVTNPRTTEATGPFHLKTYDIDGISEIDSGYDLTVAMTKATPLENFSVRPSNQTNGAENTYTFSVQSVVPLLDGDKIQFTFPKQVLPPTQDTLLNCKSEKIEEILCQVSGQSVTVIFVKLAQSTGTFTWTIDNIRNPPNTKRSDAFYDIKISDENDFLVSEYKVDNQRITNVYAAHILNFELDQADFSASETTTYIIWFEPSNPIPAGGSMQLVWPEQVKISPTETVCKIETNNDYGNENCKIVPSTNTIQITDVFNTDTFSNRVTITLVGVKNPVNNKGGNGFSLKTCADEDCYFLIGVIGNTNLVPTLDCDYPCRSCRATDRTWCQGCWLDSLDDPWYLMSTDAKGACQNQCDDGFSRDGDESYRCVPCDETCSLCREDDRMKCLACAPEFPFMITSEQKCVERCNEGLYQSSDTTCSRCEAPCYDCEGTANTCTSCHPGSDFPDLYEQTCIEQCPDGFTSIANVCQKCTSPCAQCSGKEDYCTICDGSNELRFAYNGNCFSQCPLGSAPKDTGANLICIKCTDSAAALCDSEDPSQAQLCIDGFYVHEGRCTAECPADYRLNAEKTSCVLITINDLGILYFPYLICALISLVLILFGKCKKKAGRTKYISTQNSITCIIVAFAAIEFLALINQAIWAFLFGTMIHFWASSFIVIIMVVLNMIFQIAYRQNFNRMIIPKDKMRKYREGRITKKELAKFAYPADQKFAEYGRKHRCTNGTIQALTFLITFKYNKMYYSRFYSFDMFKARWTQGKYYRKFMTCFCIIHLLIDALIIIVGAAGLYQMEFMSNMLYVTLIETVVLSFFNILLGSIELFKMKDYLKYNESGGNKKWGNLKANQAVDVFSGDFLDKNSRQDMMRDLLRNVNANQNMFLNNKLDDLFAQFNGRECRSMIELSTGWDKVEDPRRCMSWPLRNDQKDDYPGPYNFSKEDAFGQQDDNVYAEAAVKDPKYEVAVQGDQEEQDFMRQLNRRKGDLLAQEDAEDELATRKQKKNRRGRKNKYYTAIDAEDDEEADDNDNLADDNDDEEDNLEIIKEQEQEEEALRKKVQEERLKQEQAQAERRAKLAEVERLRMEAERAEEIARSKAQDEEDRLRGEQEKLELARMSEMDQQRKQLEQEEQAERQRREAEERDRQANLAKQSEENRLKYEADEAARKASQAEEEERARKEAETNEKRVQDELNEQKRKRQEESARLQAERDAQELQKKKEQLEEDERRRQADKLAEQTQVQLTQAENEAQKVKSSNNQRQTKEAEDRVRRERDEADRKQKLQQEELDRQKRFADEEAERLRLAREKELQEHKDRLAAQEKAHKDALAKEEAARKAKLAEQEKELKKMSARQKKQFLADQEKQRKELEEKQAQETARLEAERKRLEETRKSMELTERSRAREMADEQERLRLEREALEAEKARKADVEEAGVQVGSNLGASAAAAPPLQEETDEVLMSNEALKDFGAAPVLQIPPNAEDRTFNVNDILGDLDRDDKGNVIVLQDNNGNNKDKQGKLTNMRGYLQSDQGDIIENMTKKIMFSVEDVDDRGEIPAPFCVEKFNFNPHDLLGDIEYDFDSKTNTALPHLLQTKQGFFVDKRGRRISKFGWLTQAGNGHIVDKYGRKKFDRKQLDNGDLPKLLNYGGKRYDVKDVVGVFDRDSNGNIMPVRSQDGQNYLVDMMGRRVNEKGYLVDERGNVIDKNGKVIFSQNHLKQGEPPKIFGFTKFNINTIMGDIEMNPVSEPILFTDANGNKIDRQGRRVNEKGYLVDSLGNVIDKQGKKMFDRVILDGDGEIPKVFRMGILKQDSGSSLSRLMEEIEKNQPSELDGEVNANNNNGDEDEQDEMEEVDDGASGNTSVDSKMGDTPANYNIPNQRFDDYEDYEAIPEEEYKTSGHKRPKRKVQRQTQQNQQPTGAQQDESVNVEMPMKRRKKKKKKRTKKEMLEYLMPTGREINMADAYGGIAKGQFRRPGVKYDRERLMNRIKTPADIPGGRAQLEALAITVAGFNKPPVGKKSLLGDNHSSHGGDSRPKPRHNNMMGGRSEFASNGDADSNLGRSMYSQQQRGSRRNLQPKSAGRTNANNNNIADMRGKRRQANNAEAGGAQRGNNNDGDFEKMFGKDIDQFLEESEWSIDEYEKMSHFSKNSGRASQQGEKIKKMEKLYLQKMESSQQHERVSQGMQSVGRGQAGHNARKGATKVKKQAFREFQDRFVDDAQYVHRGEILEFETSKGGSSGKKRSPTHPPLRDGPPGGFLPPNMR